MLPSVLFPLDVPLEAEPISLSDARRTDSWKGVVESIRFWGIRQLSLLIGCDSPHALLRQPLTISEANDGTLRSIQQRAMNNNVNC
jgi:hypothetical protein